MIFPMNCWKCFKPLAEVPKRTSFRAECPACGSYLHVCRNCKFYTPGRPNDCAIPGTDPVRDREMMNFCDEFEVKPASPSPPKVIPKIFRDD